MLLVLSFAQPTVGAPLPTHGRLLGPLDEEAWTSVVTKALAHYTRDHSDMLNLLIFKEVTSTYVSLTNLCSCDTYEGTNQTEKLKLYCRS